MATVALETLTAVPKYFPFTGLTASVRSASGIARAQVSLVWEQTTLSATTAGSIKGVSFQGSLQRNFAYVYVGGHLSIGRTADADVLNLSRGVYFENKILAALNGEDFSSSWTLDVSEAVNIENDTTQAKNGTFNRLARETVVSTWHEGTPGHFDPYVSLYKKTYNDSGAPRIIFRGVNQDVTLNANVANMIEDPFPGGEYIALGEMHFLQYDMDQAYNYNIHSPQPVR